MKTSTIAALKTLTGVCDTITACYWANIIQSQRRCASSLPRISTNCLPIFKLKMARDFREKKGESLAIQIAVAECGCRLFHCFLFGLPPVTWGRTGGASGAVRLDSSFMPSEERCVISDAFQTSSSFMTSPQKLFFLRILSSLSANWYTYEPVAETSNLEKPSCGPCESKTGSTRRSLTSPFLVDSDPELKAARHQSHSWASHPPVRPFRRLRPPSDEQNPQLSCYANMAQQVLPGSLQLRIKMAALHGSPPSSPCPITTHITRFINKTAPADAMTDSRVMDPLGLH